LCGAAACGAVLLAVLFTANSGHAGAAVQGDVNCDNTVNSIDALDILLHVSHLPENAACLDAAGNVDCNAAIDSIDALLDLDYTAHLPANQPPGCPHIGDPLSSPTATPAPTPTGGATTTGTPTPSGATPTPPGSPTSTGGETPTPAVTPTVTPTPSPTPSGAGSATATAPVTPTPTPTPAPSPTPTPSPTLAPQDPCDGLLASNSSDPLDALKAMGLCSGITSAEWTLPDGAAVPTGTPGTAYHRGHGIRTGWGTNVFSQEGISILVLSSANAADENDTNPPYAADVDKGYTHAYPANFPASDPGCPDHAGTAADGIALKVTVSAPPGATSFSFDWKYYTMDYPEWVCSPYVDDAAVFVNDANEMTLGGQPVSANSAMEQCENGVTGYGGGGVAGTHNTCTGVTELAGTGFDVPSCDAASTGRICGGASLWHTTTVPVSAGATYTILFSIWDSSDPSVKSTVLFDKFRWHQ
jgi:hypothetical protein